MSKLTSVFAGLDMVMILIKRTQSKIWNYTLTSESECLHWIDDNHSSSLDIATIYECDLHLVLVCGLMYFFRYLRKWFNQMKSYFNATKTNRIKFSLGCCFRKQHENIHWLKIWNMRNVDYIRRRLDGDAIGNFFSYCSGVDVFLFGFQLLLKYLYHSFATLINL